jgi:hypothetical protein
LFREVGGSSGTTNKEYAQLGDPIRLPSGLWLVWYLDWWLCIFEFSDWELLHICMYGGRCGRDRMVVGLTTTYVISAYHHWCCEFESRSERGIQHYVIKVVIDLRQVGGFLLIIRIPPPIKLIAMI